MVLSYSCFLIIRIAVNGFDKKMYLVLKNISKIMQKAVTLIHAKKIKKLKDGEKSYIIKRKIRKVMILCM